MYRHTALGVVIKRIAGCGVLMATLGIICTFFYTEYRIRKPLESSFGNRMLQNNAVHTQETSQTIVHNNSLQDYIHKFLGYVSTDSRLIGKNASTMSQYGRDEGNDAQLFNETITQDIDDEQIMLNEIRMKNNNKYGGYFQIRDTKVYPVDANFIIDGATICEEKADYMKLLILVPTVANRTINRDAIRSTWGSYSKQGLTIPHTNINVTVRLAFLIGKPVGIESETTIQSESEQYGDIVYADFIDTYRNLTRKMVIGLKWVSKYCSDADFILKVDDDFFVKIPLLVTMLHNQPYSDNGSVYGTVYYHREVVRKGKWTVTLNEYPLAHYPAYIAGVYVISGNIVSKLSLVSAYFPELPMEDVFISGFLVKLIHASHVMMDDFDFDYYVTESPCSFAKSKAILTTNVTGKTMLQFWFAFIDYEKVCFWT